MVEEIIFMSSVKVSIIIPTYNAPKYCKITLDTLKRTQGVDYEVIVVDNSSRWITKILLLWCWLRGKINRLCLLDENMMFACGNNIGALQASSASTHILLLNSDMNIKDPLWLKKLLNLHRGGITSYGVVDDPKLVRADGYCLLIDRDLYRRHQLDEKFKWFWSVTKLQGEILREGFSVIAVRYHDDIIYHYGGKSGKRHLRDDESNFRRPDTSSWFGGQEVQVRDHVDKED